MLMRTENYICVAMVSLLFGCGGNSQVTTGDLNSTPPPPVEGMVDMQPHPDNYQLGVSPTEQPDMAGFPAFPADVPSGQPRQYSYVDSQTLAADEFYSKSMGAFINGDTNLEIPAPAGGYDWAIYRFEGFLKDEDVLGITVNFAEPYATDYFLGVADYELDAWRWFKITAPFSTNTIGIPWQINPINGDGSTYVGIVASSMQLSITSVSMDSGITPAPLGLEASKDTRPDRIDLTWEDMAVPYPYTLYDSIVVERAYLPGGPWEQIAELAEGTTGFEDVFDPVYNQLPHNTDVYYKLRTKLNSNLGPQGQGAVGSRLLKVVGGLSASDGNWAARTEVTWEPIPGVDSYELEYMSDDTGVEPSDWTPLETVDGELANLFIHSLDNPVTQPCILNTTYRYRVRAALHEDRSIGWSNIDTGYRALSPINNFAASDGTSAGEVTISWDTVSGASGYLLQYHNTEGGDPTSWTELAQISGEENAEFDHTYNSPSGKECGYATVYNYRVKPLLGIESADVWGQADLGHRLVDDVNGFTATTNEFQDKVQLGWEPVASGDGYEIEYKNNAGGDPVDWSLLAYVTGRETVEFEHTGSTPAGSECEPNTIYNYRIKAGFINDRSMQWTTGAGSRYLDAPENFLASAQWYPDRVSLSWDLAEGATGYEIYRDVQDAPIDTVGAVGLYDDAVGDFDAHTYWVIALDPGGESGFSSPSTGERVEWIIQAVDSTGDVGEYCALALIGGNPAISYYDASTGVQSLWYAQASITLPTGPGDWSSHEVASLFGGDYPTGMHNALVELPNGNPAVCFRSDAEYNLYYAYASTPTPASAGDWSTYEIDTSAYSGLYSSMAIVGGNPAISFYNGSLQYTRATVANPTGTGDWVTHEIDGTGDCGWYTALLEINNVPVVGYYEHDPGTTLKFATANSSNPGSGGDWDIVSVDSSPNDIGRYCSVAEDIGKPVLAYLDKTQGDLMFSAATSGTPQGPSDWQTIRVDQQGATGLYTGVQFLNGLPVISYYDEDLKCLRIALLVDTMPPGSTEWVTHTVDASSADVGVYAKLQVIGGELAIAYYDAADTKLKYARTN